MKNSNAVMKLLAALLWCVVSVGCVADQSAKTQIVNPMENYTKFRELLVQYSEPVHEKIKKGHDFCPSLVDEIEQDKYVPLVPVGVVNSNDELKEYVNKHYGCSNFSIEKQKITDTRHGWDYVAEPPFYVYEVNLGDKKYFGHFASGYKEDRPTPKTKELDFEGNSGPEYVIYSEDNCQRAGGWGFDKLYSDLLFASGGMLLKKDKMELVGYSYGIWGHKIEMRFEKSFHQENTYCAASNIKLINTK